MYKDARNGVLYSSSASTDAAGNAGLLCGDPAARQGMRTLLAHPLKGVPGALQAAVLDATVAPRRIAATGAAGLLRSRMRMALRRLAVRAMAA